MKDARIAELESAGNLPNTPVDTDVLYPGFEDLDDDAQESLTAYTNAVTNKAKEEISKDPAIVFARQTYNENKWETGFNETAAKYPELQEAKDDFKTQYFNSSNVPDNIGDILETMAKSYLFDKARDIGAEEGKIAAERVQLEDTTGGDKSPSVHRSLSDWSRLARENPAKFALQKKEYEADLASGKLKE